MHLCWVGCLNVVTSWSASRSESLLKQTVIWSVGGQKDVRGFPALPSPIPYPSLHGHVTPNASCVTVNNPAFVKLSQIKANPLWIDFFVVVFINILVIILWFPPSPRFLPSVFQNMCAWLLGKKKKHNKTERGQIWPRRRSIGWKLNKLTYCVVLKKKGLCFSMNICNWMDWRVDDLCSWVSLSCAIPNRLLDGVIF